MVCLPCIIYPFFLWLWYEWIYPYIRPYVEPIVMKVWNQNKAKIGFGDSKATTTTDDKKVCPGAAGGDKTTNQTAQAKCPLSLGKKDS